MSDLKEGIQTSSADDLHQPDDQTVDVPIPKCFASTPTQTCVPVLCVDVVASGGRNETDPGVLLRNIRRRTHKHEERAEDGFAQSQIQRLCISPAVQSQR
eukprot:TRINITY_DN63761_c0_g1_i1.p3 TRINITY_DN63761_c0_g1~~TRINITY_DN63761_c0_g1_i1.p3  ORF type:complete len:100 (+),score=17.76 TRINITY_DN63761_c0_g1_i1:284-583(+)